MKFSWMAALTAALLFSGTVRAQNGPTEADADQYVTLPGDYAASQILITYKGAERASDEVTRSRREAKAFAEELTAKLAKEPELFESLAREHSDGPTSVLSGNLRSFSKGAMTRPFEKGVEKLEIGEITPKPVKSEFGYHIIRRNPMRVMQYGVKAIVATYLGAWRIRGIPDDSPVLRRPKAEARSLIAALADKVAPENFEEMAAKHSDIDKAGAFLGVFKHNDSPLADQLIQGVKGLEYGQISEPVELNIGFALLQRVKLVRRHAARIWIAHRDAVEPPLNSDAAGERDRETALSLARDLCNRLSQDPEQFAELAKQHSDGPFSVRGGEMPRWYVGFYHPAFESAVAELDADEITAEPVETPDGFFIVKRFSSD